MSRAKPKKKPRALRPRILTRQELWRCEVLERELQRLELPEGERPPTADQSAEALCEAMRDVGRLERELAEVEEALAEATEHMQRMAVGHRQQMYADDETDAEPPAFGTRPNGAPLRSIRGIRPAVLERVA